MSVSINGVDRGNVSKVFKYTVDETSGKLNKRQREFYEENGFIVIPNLVSEELIDECKQVNFFGEY